MLYSGKVLLKVTCVVFLFWSRSCDDGGGWWFVIIVVAHTLSSSWLRCCSPAEKMMTCPPAADPMLEDRMSVAVAHPEPDVLRRVLRLQVLTIVWMTVEAAIALAAAWAARSPALLGFGGDSAIELL